MNEIVKGIFSAPLPTIFIISGVIFLLIAVIGNISGKIEPGIKGRVLSGLLGLTFIVIGLSIHFSQEETNKRSVSEPTPVQIKSDQLAITPKATPDSMPEQVEKTNTVPVSLSLNQEKESNDIVPNANLIIEGASIRGSIEPKQDRDAFQVTASSNKTRAILRKLSAPGIPMTVDIYDEDENKVAEKADFQTHGDDTISLSFESVAGRIYFIVVKSYDYLYHGNYELTVRNDL